MSKVGSVGRVTSSEVLVGLSGGVDSSVAAWLLKSSGYNVVAVTMALADSTAAGDAKSSGPKGAIEGARAVADRLGIPHYAVDLRNEFNQHVVDYFVSEYAVGRTPNPCCKCNSRIRFNALAEVAERLGASLVATGHYARLTGHAKRLARARDLSKDQSYVLAEVAPQLLAGCVFPLGDLTKVNVRAIAAELGIANLTSKESQEICFVPGDDYRAFLRARLGERPGQIVDLSGKVLGQHRGTYNFTIGQRKGLRYAAGRPMYVTAVRADTAEVVVEHSDKGAARVVDFRLAALHGPLPRGHVDVQVRSMGAPVGGRMRGPESVLLDVPLVGVAPGQTIVIYEKDEVVLGGTITRARCRESDQDCALGKREYAL